MKLDLQLEQAGFADALKQFIRHHRMELPAALRLQGRFLARKAMDYTPPQKGPAQGRKAVDRDIRRLFFGLRSAQEEDRWQSLGGDQVMRLFATKTGTVYGVEKALFNPSASHEDMAAHHQRYRDTRGRVTRAGTRTRDVGRWRFVDKMVVPQGSLEAYIKRKQQNVGRAKGGWAAALSGLGGTPPAYARRWQALGSLTDRATNPVNAYILMENRSEWARGREDDRVVTNALKAQRVAILKALEKAQATALHKAGLK